MTCGVCRYYQNEFCFRYPPVPFANGVEQRPHVGKKFRACGEFKKQETMKDIAEVYDVMQEAK